VRRSLFTYFSITYATTWACWLASRAILGRNGPDTPLGVFAAGLFLLGTFAPGLIALAFTEKLDGRRATQQLFGRVFKWDVGVRWYVFAIAYIPAVKLLVAVLHRVLTGAWPRFGHEAWYVMAGVILISTWAQAGEEIGWRGYVLPGLSERFGLASASMIIGVIWASWHIPIFFFRDTDLFGQSFPLYLLQVTAISVTMAWLYWRTGGSLLLVMILHAAVNNTKDIVPSAEPGATSSLTFNASLVGWLTVAVLWIVAIYFLAQMKTTRLLILNGPAARVNTQIPPRLQE
jgi:membrane protease YdiL (CAAX protease family)